MIETIFAAWLGILVAQLAPGPNLMAVASVALRQGRMPGLFVALGVASGITIWVVACAAGIVGALLAFPTLDIAFRLIGGGYLLYLSLKAIGAAIRNRPSSLVAANRQRSLFASWRLGFFVVLTNPKAALMWLAVSAFVFSANVTPLQFLLFIPIGSASAILIYGGYAMLFSTRTANTVFSRFARWFELAFGAVFGALATKLISDGVREMRT